MIVKEKFAPNWSDNFLYSKSFDFSNFWRHIRLKYLKFRPEILLCSGSSVGRASDFGSSDPGSNPSGATFFPSLFFAFLPYVCFTKMGICHLFSLVNFFIATFLQALYLVTQKVFFQNHYMDSPIRGKVPLVNIVLHVVLHQKMHVLLSGDFWGRSTAVWAPCERCIPWEKDLQL